MPPTRMALRASLPLTALMVLYTALSRKQGTLTR